MLHTAWLRGHLAFGKGLESVYLHLRHLVCPGKPELSSSGFTEKKKELEPNFKSNLPDLDVNNHLMRVSKEELMLDISLDKVAFVTLTPCLCPRDPMAKAAGS